MDASGSIQPPDFKKQIDFVKNLIIGMKLSEDEQKVGIIIFSSVVDVNFPFSANSAQLLNLLSTYIQSAGNTYTNTALLTGVNMFTQYSRHDAIRMMFILTDGGSTDGIQPTTIQSFKNLNVARFAIGVGTDIVMAELMLISGDNATDSSHVYSVDNFSSIKNILYNIQVTQCSQPLNYTSVDSPVTLTFGQGNTYAQVSQAVFGTSMVLITIDHPKPNNTGLGDVPPNLRLFFSHNFELPGEFINDGEGQVNGDKIEAFVPFNGERTRKKNTFYLMPDIVYISVYNAQEQVYVAELLMNRIKSDGCPKNCRLCLTTTVSCKLCMDEYSIENGGCVYSG